MNVNPRIKLALVKETKDQGIISFILTKKVVDRDSEVVLPKGLDFTSYKKNPVVLWAHDMHSPPIGKILTETIKTTDEEVEADVKFDMADPFAKLIHDKYQNGFLNAGSIRFIPKEIGDKPILPDQKGATITKSEMLEFSPVPVPANQEALRKEFGDGSGTIEKGSKQDQWLSMLKEFMVDDNYDHTPEGWIDKMNKVDDEELKINKLQNVKIIKGFEKDFDIDKEELVSHQLIYEWASRFCGCNIKDLFMTTTGCSSLWKGSFLSAFNGITKDWNLHDTRNLTHKGTEKPPVYETMQLNSKETMSFFVEGTSFYITSKKYKAVVGFEQSWNQMLMTVYCDRKYAEEVNEFIGSCWDWARRNHKMRGEAFSLSGDFLQRKDIDFSHVFLTEKNKSPLQRIVRLINDKGSNCANRGIILMGAPGTGKTLSGRIIMSLAKSTFIWISAKDFWHMGSVAGLARAFSLAKTLSPTILFIEDVDNWMGGTTIDLFKTEMDGIDQTDGIVTMITTNFPEKMPDALIDRPGRFHDVLEFDLPAKNERRQMLECWVSEADQTTIDEFVDKTEGYSGAHLYELSQYVKIICEEDGLEIKQALDKALNKIKEQRELINENQLAGSNYRKSFTSSTSFGEIESFQFKDLIKQVILEMENKSNIPYKFYELEDEFTELNEDRIDSVDAYCYMKDGKKLFKHHHIKDNELVTVWRGVAAAMIDLLQGEHNLDDEQKEKIYQHLAEHYKEFEKEPPEFKKSEIISEENLEESQEEIEESDDNYDKAIEEIIREKI